MQLLLQTARDDCFMLRTDGKLVSLHPDLGILEE